MREPLLWFVLLGIGIFGLDRLWPEAEGEAVTIVTEEVVAALVAGFEGAQGRAPSEAELDALVETHADQERALREARELGLGRADPVVRRRLLQKLDFLDAGGLPEPDDATLQSFLDANRDRHVRPSRTNGMALLLPEGIAVDVALARLSAGAVPGTLGVARPHPPAWTDLDAAQVGERTSAALTDVVARVETDVWHPVVDGDQTWLVRVTGRTSGGTPALQDIREAVRADWEEAEKERRREAARAARRARWPTDRR